MGSRIRVVGAVTIAVLVSGGAVAAGGDSGKSRTTRLSLQIETQELTLVDTGPAGSSPGDMIVEADNLTRRGKPFGTAQITCIAHVAELADGRAECSGTFYLPKGQLETQQGVKSVNGSISGAGAVTGGTGSYHGARGSFVFHTTTGTDRAIQFKMIR